MWLLPLLVDVTAPGDRLEVVRIALTVGAGTGGIVALVLAGRRQWSVEQAHRATEHDATERRITELYTKAVDQLGSDQAAVRLGGLYALERLANTTSTQQGTIGDVICAYLRMPYIHPSTLDKNATEDERKERDRLLQERETRQTALEILVRHNDPERGMHWPGLHIRLQRANLTNTNLANAHLTDADLTGANLSGAYLIEANLTGASLTDADLRGTRLTEANLAGAYLINADLTGAYLVDTNLTRAYLIDADLTGVHGATTGLHSAFLIRAKLIDADLTGANLTNANLTEVDLTGANLTNADLSNANLTRAKLAAACGTPASWAGATATDAVLTEVQQQIDGQMSQEGGRQDGPPEGAVNVHGSK
jgi:uncharacterized protein YjbI with pentapeptide repeats